MSVPVTILALALLALVVLVVSAPLRAAGRARVSGGEAAEEAQHGVSPSPPEDEHELRTQRDAKYREIRDAELDYRTGKLSKEDYETIDAQLRAEAFGILDRLEKAGLAGGGDASGRS